MRNTVPGTPCVDGIKLHWSSTGQNPRTVILVHGWTCDHTTWKSQIPALAGKYRVLTLDLPGHGKSDAPIGGKFSMDLFARAVESVRREAGADRVVLVGHSMGTPVIVRYARLFPRHVSAMVFVDGVVRIPNMGPVARLPGLLVALPALRKAMIRSTFSSSTTPDMRKHILSMMMGTPTATAVGALNATFDPAIWKGDVVTQPVLGLYAERFRHNREYIKTHFPNLEYVEIAGSGHFLMLEEPDEFNRLLLGFLSKQAF
jgi:pimeloyl-ACP methyl ester carboxylesterase